MGKIIITGPGRAGTTFLVMLLTRMGLDTGFSAYNEPYRSDVRAGLEWPVHFDFDEDTPEVIRERIAAAPRVLKSPEWGMCLKALLSGGMIDVDHVLIPLRDLDVAARSRLAAGLDWMVDPELEGQAREEDQANIMAMALGRALEACFLFEIPCTVLRFPALVSEIGYCYEKLKGIAPDWLRFEQEFRGLARPEQVVHGG